MLGETTPAIGPTASRWWHGSSDPTCRRRTARPPARGRRPVPRARRRPSGRPAAGRRRRPSRSAARRGGTGRAAGRARRRPGRRRPASPARRARRPAPGRSRRRAAGRWRRSPGRPRCPPSAVASPPGRPPRPGSRSRPRTGRPPRSRSGSSTQLPAARGPGGWPGRWTGGPRRRPRPGLGLAVQALRVAGRADAGDDDRHPLRHDSRITGARRRPGRARRRGRAPRRAAPRRCAGRRRRGRGARAGCGVDHRVRPALGVARRHRSREHGPSLGGRHPRDQRARLVARVPPTKARAGGRRARRAVGGRGRRDRGPATRVRRGRAARSTARRPPSGRAARVRGARSRPGCPAPRRTPGSPRPRRRPVAWRRATISSTAGSASSRRSASRVEAADRRGEVAAADSEGVRDADTGMVEEGEELLAAGAGGGDDAHRSRARRVGEPEAEPVDDVGSSSRVQRRPAPGCVRCAPLHPGRAPARASFRGRGWQASRRSPTDSLALWDAVPTGVARPPRYPCAASLLPATQRRRGWIVES